MSEREQRLARNEALFREVNENIQKVAQQVAAAREEHVYEYCCECANVGCSERVELTTAEYERLRADATRFAPVEGHELPEIETVVERFRGCVIVEKRDEAAEVAEQTDPRT
ncbi:MAG: hypothetical protein ACRDLK_11465 [Gaiellaceae bacterium]